MKVYNKKGFAGGVVAAALGAASVLLAIFKPSDMGALNVKHLIVGGFVLLGGIVAVVRSLSRTATREDLIEERDERNVLVALKARARTMDVVFWMLVALFAAGVLGFYFTKSDVFFGLFLFSGLLGVFASAVSVATAIYYERRG